MASQTQPPKQQPPPRKKIPCDPTGPAGATNIDRRTCQRVVPMRVLALGVSRTGTSSLRQALVDLGYTDCYHFASLMNDNPRDCEMWVEAFQAKFEGKGKPFTRADWDQLLGHCQAVADTPCAVFYRELLEAYPDTKVVLTMRDSPQQWWESQMRTIMPFFERFSLPPRTWKNWLWRQFLPAPTAFDKLNEMLPQHYPMYRLLAEDMRTGSRIALKWYEDYYVEIQRIVPKERLLIMNVKEGWEPLCGFLGEDVPGWEFPKLNTSEEWYHNAGAMNAYVDGIVWWNAVKKLAPVAIVGLAVAGGYAWRWKYW